MHAVILPGDTNIYRVNEQGKYRTQVLQIFLVKFGYPFKTHYYFIARWTLISQVAAPMLSRVTWAFLRLLVGLFKLVWPVESRTPHTGKVLMSIIYWASVFCWPVNKSPGTKQSFDRVGAHQPSLIPTSSRLNLVFPPRNLSLRHSL